MEVDKLLARKAIETLRQPLQIPAAEIRRLQALARPGELERAWDEVRDEIDRIMTSYEVGEKNAEETAARIFLTDARYLVSDRMAARLWVALTRGRLEPIRAAQARAE